MLALFRNLGTSYKTALVLATSSAYVPLDRLAPGGRKHADAPDTVALLRARRKRPRCRASEPDDECAPYEPSLGVSIGLLCVLLFAIFAIVSTVSVPDIQFVQTDFLADL
jgi:hypothetical protein